MEIDGEFIKQWRSVSVDGLDMSKIEDYLDKQGIRSMQVGGSKFRAFPLMSKACIFQLDFAHFLIKKNDKIWNIEITFSNAPPPKKKIIQSFSNVGYCLLTLTFSC